MKTEISISTETLLKVTLVGLVLFFLWAVKDLIVVLLIAIVLSSALEPMVAALHRKRIPRAVSVLSVYILAILLLVLMGYLIFPPLISEYNQLTSNSGALSAAFQQKLADYHIMTNIDLGSAISHTMQAFGLQFSGSDSFFQRTLGFFNGFLEIVTILVVSFYLVAEQNSMRLFVVSVVPEGMQNKITHLVHKIQLKIGAWLIGQFILSCIVFLMTFIGLTLLHVQYALVLAILAGVFELVPYIGPFISAVPAIFFAFVQSPPLAIAVALLYLIVQKTEGYVFVPKIMQRAIGVSPLIILVAILVGLKLAGIYGVILAVPLVAAINVYIQERNAEIEAAKHPEHLAAQTVEAK